MKPILDQMIRQLGWQGMAGIALLAVAGGFLVLGLKPLERETAAIRDRVEQARAKVSMQARTMSLHDRQQELGAFFDSLPREQEVTDIMAAIYSTAEASKVALKEADYDLQDKNGPGIEYKMTFPVEGEYETMRLFVSRVLAAHPAISLDRIDFRRDRINDPVLKAEIQLTLFVRPGK